jgi:hypothetical protein
MRRCAARTLSATHARDHGHADRADLFDGLIQRTEANGTDHTCPQCPSIRAMQQSSPRMLAYLADWLPAARSQASTKA